MRINNIPKSDIDYVEFYALKLKKNNKFFKDHKKFIESQYKGSSSLFRNKFGIGDEFKINARIYLKSMNLLWETGLNLDKISNLKSSRCWYS